MTKFIGLIPARGGSKGIPKKNLYEVAGIPLIDYTIQAASNCEVLSEVFLSTDDREIASRAKNTRIQIPELRPSKYARDETLTVDVAIHAIQQWIKVFSKNDYLVLLQPTSPLRTTSHIIEACKLLVRNQLIADSLVSVSNVGGNHPARMKVIDEHGLLKNFSGEEDEDMRPRQLLPSVYIRNGAIYINRIEDIVEKKRLVASKCLPFVMTNRESINIDSIEDVLLASKILQNGL